MSLSSREKILSAVELALGFPPKDPSLIQPGPGPQQVAWVPAQEPWEPLQKELEALSARFHRVETLEQFPAVLEGILKDHQVKSSLCWEHPLLEKLRVKKLLREANVELIDFTEPLGFVQKAAGVDLGITAAECAIVESGALMVRASEGWPRAASLLPPVHVAVLTARQRIRSVGELVPIWREWLSSQGLLPSGIHLITGPSRTADIELTLVLGAHGPKVLHVVALDEKAIPEDT